MSTNFTVDEEYTLLIADYDGGPFASVNFVAKEDYSSSTGRSFQVPNTGIY